MATGRELHLYLPAGPVQPRRLLDVLPSLGLSEDRWMAGVTWEPTVCRALYTDNETVCATGDINITPIECQPWVVQVPFRIVDAMKYTHLDLTFDEVETRLEAFYNRAVSAAFARELISGAASTGAALSKQATAPVDQAFGSAAVPVWNALATLEEEIALRLQGGVGYIFLTPGLLAQAALSYRLILVGDHWETPSGNWVISDAGFVDPTPPTGQAASGVNKDWMYASGPVYVQSSGPTLVGEGSETYRFTRDTFIEWIEGYGILVFDPCPVTAVLASYALD